MTSGKAVDPVCGMTVDPETAKWSREYEGKKYYFCNPRCLEKFSADPAKYLSPQPASMPVLIQPSKMALPVHPQQAGAGQGEKTEAKVIDPVCGMTVDPATAKWKYEHEGKKYYFCRQQCLEKFSADP